MKEEFESVGKGLYEFSHKRLLSLPVDLLLHQFLWFGFFYLSDLLSFLMGKRFEVRLFTRPL